MKVGWRMRQKKSNIVGKRIPELGSMIGKASESVGLTLGAALRQKTTVRERTEGAMWRRETEGR